MTVLLAFAVSIGVLVYVLGGYVALLRLLVLLRGRRKVAASGITPSVSLVISAYNEATIMRRKLENALALDYPAGKLEIVVISDASSDATDDIVREFASRGVELVRQAQRRGKTGGLNLVVPALTGEIVVFSDANAMYRPDAIRKLVRNFADPAVGCVTGEARYTTGTGGAADAGERLYWRYETHLKRLETALGSMVGGDGAIYAIRRSLWRTLPDDSINDFLNPLQIVAAGWRNVYEPEAVCFEETAGRVHSEYRRRVRIVGRSWRAVFQAPEVLNPFRVGLFAWCLISHKVLRWHAGLFLLAAFASGGALVIDILGESPVVTAAAGAMLVLAGLTPLGRRTVAMAAYFAVIYAASVVGLLTGTLGRVSGIWSTAREQTPAVPATRLIPVGRLFVATGIVTGAAIGAALWFAPNPTLRLLFWSSVGFLVYTYIGYPALLASWTCFVRRPVRSAPLQPTVSLLIAANNEASVIEAKLRNSLALDYPPERLNIVVASDGSDDGTNSIVRRFAPRVRLVELAPRRGKTEALNEGMRTIGDEIVVFSDANTFLEPGAIAALVRNFADPEVGGVSADVALVGEHAALAKSEELYSRYERWLQHAESKIGSMIGADGALYAIRRDLFVPAAPDTILDDMAIPMAIIRAGRRIVFEPDARASEQAAETALEEFTRKVRVIAGAGQFIRRSDSSVPLRAPQVILSLVSHKALRWVSPVFMACALATAAMLVGASPTYSAAIVVQAALLTLGIVGCAPRLRQIRPIAVVHYFCLMQTAAAVGFVRGLTGGQSVLWQRFARVPATAPAGQRPR